MEKKMKVFKFGGGSVKDADGVRQLGKIIRQQGGVSLVVVVSAIGKTTNAMEQIVAAYREGNRPVLHARLCQLQEEHQHIARQLHPDSEGLLNALSDCFESLDQQLALPPSEDYDADYDRIVSFGEILSTALVSAYLRLAGMENHWLDARSLIRTDRSFREARVHWEPTLRRIQERVERSLHEETAPLFITQGFIGGTEEGDTTTLGREGSDYTAAIFGFALQASEVVIWKDVDGLFNADPKIFPEAVKLEEIPYEEAIELSYYGASIIHPKTLKPLQNRQIPLYVKPFFHPRESGSRIAASTLQKPVPSFIVKQNQILLSIFPKDFSFISVESLSEIFTILSRHRLKINLMQNSALSFSLCMDYAEERVRDAVTELRRNYTVKCNEPVVLATIRHYTGKSLERITQGMEILVEQKTRATVQVVLKEQKR